LQKELSVFDLQCIAEEVSTKLPQQDDWFSTGIQKWIRTRLTADGTLFTDQRLLDVIGRSTIFDKAVVKSLMEMYVEKIANIEHSVVNGNHTILESELVIGSSKPASIADSAIHMQENETSQARNNMKTVAQRPEETLATETTPRLAAQVLPEQHPDTLVEKPLETPVQSKEKIEDLSQTQNLPTATDSDGEVAKAKPAKKKKNKKKKKTEVVVAPETIDEP